MRIHHQAITTIILSAVLAVSASTADAQSLPARIRAIRSARTPSDASAAYRAALRQDRTSLSAREAFVERLIALGKPARAQSAARLLVTMDDDSAVGWSAILLTQVQREQYADAIETLRAHSDSLKDRDGIPASAGRLVAWYQEHRRTSPQAFALRRKVDVIRATFGQDEAYRTALHEAAAKITQPQTADQPDAPARVESTRNAGANQPARLDEAPARRESAQKDRSHSSDARRPANRQDSTGEDRPQDRPLIGVDNPPLNSDDFNIAQGLQIDVSHTWGDSHVQGRLALDPQISNIFSGSVIGFRSVAAPGGRYVTLSGGGGTFSHGTIQMIAIPTVILFPREDQGGRPDNGWINPGRTRRRASTKPVKPAKPTTPADSSTKSTDQVLPPWQREPQKSAREEIIRKRLLERSRPARRSSSVRRSETTSPQRTRRSRTGWGTSADSTQSTWGNP
ncbi:MAG: bacterial transcriptional activator domain-containing protein [Planctomycetota bacterium]